MSDNPGFLDNPATIAGDLDCDPADIGAADPADPDGDPDTLPPPVEPQTQDPDAPGEAAEQA